MRYADEKCEWECDNAEVDMCSKDVGEGVRSNSWVRGPSRLVGVPGEPTSDSSEPGDHAAHLRLLVCAVRPGCAG
jgi:hypothetical protein